MTLFQAVILGIVQGLTEFLPVSSSGHLVLANYYFGFSSEGESLELAVDIATNTGTFLAVLLVLRRDVWKALSGFLSGLVSAEARKSEGWRLALFVILGSIPTAIIILGLRSIFEVLNKPFYVSFALIATGLILWFAPKSGSKETARELTWKDALITGVAQGLAGIPGVSRSGTTISVLLWRGAEADLAARFSFLMYLVASFGVAILGVADVREAGLEFVPILGMTVASFVTGYVALVWLFSLLRKGQFKWFAPYLWVVALITLASVALT